MKVRFWGARASIPTPSRQDFSTCRYGGNTTCVSVSIPGHLLILDAGSGLRELGRRLMSEPNLRASFFFTHLHWDHIQGFPFFIPAYKPGCALDLHGERATQPGGLRDALQMQQQEPFFPLPLVRMAADLRFHDLAPGAALELPGESSKLLVTPVPIHHPGGCLGYRIEETAGERRGAFFFATDIEHFEDERLQLKDAARGVAVLAYDAQYSPDEYQGRDGWKRQGWGHSTWRHGVREAHAAGARRLVLIHHDPQHDDWEIARLESEARREAQPLGLQVDAAHEGLEIEI
jgi:phosphoribosyl 1,2-cyclic phosphodiesterase